MKHWLFFLALAAAAPAQAVPLYLCRAYGGGEFWSSVLCSRQQAVIVRITEVPAALPFEQQVQLARQAKAEGERLAAPPLPAPVAAPRAARPAPDECAAIDAHIRHLDALARQPHSGPGQDAIAAQRRTLRDRQFALKCR